MRFNRGALGSTVRFHPSVWWLDRSHFLTGFEPCFETTGIRIVSSIRQEFTYQMRRVFPTGIHIFSYFLIFSGLWQLVVSFFSFCALGKLTEPWEITIFDRSIKFLCSFSIAMWVYRRVNPIVYIYIWYPYEAPMKIHLRISPMTFATILLETGGSAHIFSFVSGRRIKWFTQTWSRQLDGWATPSRHIGPTKSENFQPVSTAAVSGGPDNYLFGEVWMFWEKQSNI